VISQDELNLLVAGAVSLAGQGIESAHGRRLTTTETERLGHAIATAMRMLAERVHVAKVPPPPPPPAPAHRPERLFAPVRTQEIRAVSDADIAKATQAGLSPVRPK